jgi:sulfonate transport system ATP-binding protein
MRPLESAGVSLDGVQKSFGARAALRDLTLSVEPGEFVSVVGRSGSGKSTLLRLLCGLEEPSGGSVHIYNREQRDVREHVRVVFQEHRLLPWRTVLANVKLGNTRTSDVRALEVLAQVGLADRASEYPGVLSGGQRQRVSLARALVHQPAMLLLDEPFGALDALTRIEAQQLVEGLWASHEFTAVLVTHDVEEAVLLSDRVYVVEDGTIIDSIAVDLPRPRTRELPEVGRLTTRLLDRVMGRSSARSLTTSGTTSLSPLPTPINAASGRVFVPAQ